MLQYPSFFIDPSLLSRADMIRADGYYLYSVGAAMRDLAGFTQQSKFKDIGFPLYVAEGALRPFLYQSIFKLKTSLQKGKELLDAITDLINLAEAEADKEKEIGWVHAYRITSGASQFETILAAEMALSTIFLVTKKRGFDTLDLVENGQVFFPEELLLKVPETELDIKQGTRCLAFELPTAAGFHFHRANESVLHRYYDAATGGKPRPGGRNIGDYLAELTKHNAGDPLVKSSLKDLKDLHRNPLIHPEQSLANVDEAIALLGSIQAVIVHMLKVIPLPPTATSIITAPVTP